MKKSMNDLINYLNSILESIEANDGELSEEILSDLELIEKSMTHKADSIFEYKREIEDRIKILNDKVTEIKLSLEGHKRRLFRLDNYLLHCMDRLGKTSIKGSYSQISYRKPTKLVEILDENKLPLEYLKYFESHTVDKIAIRKKLKNGELVDGATLTDSPRYLKGKLA